MFIFYFQRKISEMRRPIGAKFCTVISTSPNFIMLVQNFGGAPPKNFRGEKHAKNMALFQTTSKFGGEYFRIGWIYSKSDEYLIYCDSSRVRWNKSREVWSSNLGDLNVKLYPSKASFSEDHISAPRGCCTPKFLHAPENDQFLLVHPPLWTRVPLTIFFKGGPKLA